MQGKTEDRGIEGGDWNKRNTYKRHVQSHKCVAFTEEREAWKGTVNVTLSHPEKGRFIFPIMLVN